ncbi:GGDEF domain-containing protein [Deinococcus depolymerans]|uniref:GGDEF domain-containing protein n=1 Tax=Deinococcus depolymerans TaxID=392408 RepID=A0ABN1BN00_9DEIO
MPSTLSPARPSERRQRQALQLLAALSTAVNGVILLYLWTQADPQRQAGRALPALLISLSLLTLTLWSRVTLRALHRLSVGVLLAWFAANVHSVVLSARPVTSGLLIHLILLALFSFTWLPVRPAALLVSAGYALLILAALASAAPDVPGVILTALTLPVIWHLTQHGLTVNRERIRSEALRTLATTDPLTGLLNRRAGQAALDTAVTVHAHHPGQLWAALIDIDHFKRVNDDLGHQTGDTLLIAVAGLLRSDLPPGGAAIRWGGEEFLLLLPDQTGEQAHARVQAMLGHVRNLRLPGVPPTTISAGLATLREAPSTRALVDLADRRLYEAKAAGRNRLTGPPVATYKDGLPDTPETTPEDARP